jgi:hypothetical protein
LKARKRAESPKVTASQEVVEGLGLRTLQASTSQQTQSSGELDLLNVLEQQQQEAPFDF